MARKCIDCKFRPQDEMVIGPELCSVCLEYADHENMHQDDGHDGGNWDDAFPRAKCMICCPELDKRYIKNTGHTNTIAKTRTSHAGCEHARTPKARAVCRRGRATGRVVTLIEAPQKPVKATRIVDASSLPMPKLTPAQLASPTLQSMMRR